MKRYKESEESKKTSLTEQEILNNIESGEYDEDGLSLYVNNIDEDMFTVGDLMASLSTIPEEYPVYFNVDGGEALRIETIDDNGQNEIIVSLTVDSIDEDPEELDEPMDDYEVAEILDVVDENEEIF